MSITTEVIPANIHKILHLLRRGPYRLSALSSSLSNQQLEGPLAPGEWSLGQILAHMLSCAQVFGSRITYALLADNPDLPKIHPQRHWARLMRYEQYPFQENIGRFYLERQALIEVLENLDENGWHRTASLDGRPTNVYQQARTMALHELEHIEDCEKAFLD